MAIRPMGPWAAEFTAGGAGDGVLPYRFNGAAAHGNRP